VDRCHCIDQDNLEERSQQVSITGQVYKKAAVVIMWIGDEVPYTKEAMFIIRRLAMFLITIGLEREKDWSEEFYELMNASIRQLFDTLQEEAAWPAAINLLVSRHVSEINFGNYPEPTLKTDTKSSNYSAKKTK
jgi:hypothetical protein